MAGGRKFNNLLDVGAGEGALLHEIERNRFANRISALEISSSGIDAIHRRNFSCLDEVRRFDGYEIPYLDNTFDVALAIHVLEHVEHERLFLRELRRVADRIIVAVPLEHTIRINKARLCGASIGHINFYTMETFCNILETSGLCIEKVYPHTTSYEYESFVSPKTGQIKYIIRKSSLSIWPKLACNLFSYMAIAMCKSQ